MILFVDYLFAAAAADDDVAVVAAAAAAIREAVDQARHQAEPGRPWRPKTAISLVPSFPSGAFRHCSAGSPSWPVRPVDLVASAVAAVAVAAAGAVGAFSSNLATVAISIAAAAACCASIKSFGDDAMAGLFIKGELVCRLIWDEEGRDGLAGELKAGEPHVFS
ncbi:hypothetical protein BpHYR1_052625 [Brachionus plicatilis]|uniref:Uncharacterized protein n=1 Tax=Brachionus plicatilis TaxID=10195 RepID=A0A3M7R5Q5_BRAPC|nr:hypothetical protein BpHYR1_052625 [Brachionus plicatilis]